MRMDRFVTNFKYSGNFMRAQANTEGVNDFGLRVADRPAGAINATPQTIERRVLPR